LNYAYVSLQLTRDRTAQKALADHVYGEAEPALKAAGGEVVAVFAPLLGFASNEASVLVRWAGEPDPAALAGVLKAPVVTAAERHDLEPTLRPADDGAPLAGGIYVHNWFTIDAEATDEFVDLSGEAWPDFEARFETKIFGLFLARQAQADRQAGAARLLLMTRYRDLGEWQVSRDPTSEAMKVFARRRELTRYSLARSCLLVARP
jgi:hypothetical protein